MSYCRDGVRYEQDLDERLHVLQDANWNVTALVDTGGTVMERYAYSAYGAPTILSAA